VAVCPLYALGGLIMLAAVRHYPRDISSVVANAQARANGRAKAKLAQDSGPAPKPDAPAPS
jgi:hypothetical protein